MYHLSRSAKARVCLAGLVALALALVAACGSSGGPSGQTGAGSSPGGGGSARDAGSGTIKIGVILPLSGPYAILGQEPLAGMQVAVQEINASGGVNGQHMELVKEDDQFNQATTVRDFRNLSSQGIHTIIAGISEPQCNALLPLLQPLKTVLLTSACSDTNLTIPKAANPYFFRVFSTVSALTGALGVVMCKQFKGIAHYGTINLEGAPEEGPGDFGHAIGQCGVTPVKTVNLPSNVTNTLPYLQSMLRGLPSDSAQSTVLLSSLFGSPLINAFKVGAPIGFTKKFRAVGTYADFDELAHSISPDVPSTYSADNYYPTAFKTALNAKFLAEFAKANKGAKPYPYNFAGYREVKVFAAAIAKAHSTDASKVATAMAGLSLPDPQGTLTIGASTHQGDVQIVVRHFDGANVTVAGVVPFDTAIGAAGITK